MKYNQISLFGKTSLESSQCETTPSERFWAGLPEKIANCTRQGNGGRTLVVCLDPKGQSRGESWMPNISAWPNEGGVSFLSDVLWEKEIPQKYFLSSKACAGILRRAEKRGKKLPELLEWCLCGVAGVKPPAIDVDSTVDDRPVPTLTAKMQGMSGWAPYNEADHLVCEKYGSHWSGGPHPTLNKPNGSPGYSDQELFAQGGSMLCCDAMRDSASLCTSTPEGISGTVSAKWAKGTGGPAGDECYNLVCQPVQYIE